MVNPSALAVLRLMINGYAIPSRERLVVLNSGDNNSRAGKFVERLVDSDHSKLLPDQQSPQRLTWPKV
jgi:hypothetical protein